MTSNHHAFPFRSNDPPAHANCRDPSSPPRTDLRDELAVGQRRGLVIAGHRDVDQRTEQRLLAAEGLYTVWIATPASAAMAASRVAA